MSVLSMRQGAAPVTRSIRISDDRETGFNGSPCGHLIAASHVRASDRVLVFGYDILDHLVGLARLGVDSAIGVHAGYPYRPHEPVDIVWFTCVSDIDAEVTRLLAGVGSPRVIAVELMAHAEFGPLRRLMWRLRDKGLDHTSYYKAAGRVIVTAWRSSASYSRRFQSDAYGPGLPNSPQSRPLHQ